MKTGPYPNAPNLPKYL